MSKYDLHIRKLTAWYQLLVNSSTREECDLLHELKPEILSWKMNDISMVAMVGGGIAIYNKNECYTKDECIAMANKILEWTKEEM